MSPTANKRRRHVPSATSNVQSASRSTASSSQPQSGSSKRSREDDGDVAATAVTPKRCRLQRGVIATPTKIQIRDTKALLPSPPIIHVDAAESLSKEAKRKYTKEERIQRERDITNFKEKYTKAFPNFRFYFHGLDAGLKKELTAKVKSLGARVEGFFSGDVTHLICNRARPTSDHVEGLDQNKENVAGGAKSGKTSSASLRSPIQLKSSRKASSTTETAAPSPSYDPLVLKAIQLSIKLWDSNKLESMLSRLLTPPPKTETRKRLPTTARPKSLQSLNAADRSNVTLSHLLQAEKQAGITNERDPKAKRPDYAYFPKNTHFLLIQDCDEAYAPVAVKDYGRWKKGDKPTWPVLNLDGVGYSNRSRAPVFGWKPEMDQAPSRKLGETATRKPDLRKSVSLHGLNRKRLSASGESLLRPPSSFLRPDTTGAGSGSFAPPKYNSGASRPSFGSVSLASGASGLPSQGYVAASGNSAILTSNIASTTSTTGLARGEADIIPGRKALHRQVVMNRAFGRQQATTTEGKDTEAALIEVDVKAKDRAVARPHILRKSKSTNTMRLPPREESKKPGYCENCRAKFEDFAKHIRGGRHTRFANNANNFMDLDETLARVRRRTLDEWQQENEFDLSDSTSDSDCEESDCEDDATFQNEADAVAGQGCLGDDGGLQEMIDFYAPRNTTADEGEADELTLRHEDAEMEYYYSKSAPEHDEPEWDGADVDEEDELSAF